MRMLDAMAPTSPTSSRKDILVCDQHSRPQQQGKNSGISHVTSVTFFYLRFTIVSPRVVPSANQNAVSNNNIKITTKKQLREKTYSLPVQKVEASDASQAITPLSSSGRPSRPSGFKPDHLSNKCGCLSRYAAVILRKKTKDRFRQLFVLLTDCGPQFPVA